MTFNLVPFPNNVRCRAIRCSEVDDSEMEATTSPYLLGEPSDRPKPIVCRQVVRSWLLSHLLTEILPIVIDYLSCLDLISVRVLGTEGIEDGELRMPSGFCLYNDELFIADYDNNRIQVFHEGTGRYLRKWSTSGPLSIAVLHDEVFVGHDGAVNVQVYGRLNGLFLRNWALAKSRGQNVQDGIVADGVSLLATDQRNKQIYVFSPNGEKLRTFGEVGFGPGQFRQPSKLFVTDDEVYIADTWNSRVQVLSKSSGKFLRQYRKLSFPEAVIAHHAEVIVCNSDQDSLVMFDRSSSLPLWSISKADVPLLRHPRDLAMNSKQQLLVCSAGSHSVLVFE